ncbi:MAG: asparagine synthase (glutamine-hydrolyzing) [Candidatus Omnitrophica bacterium]|nr:asparagine synthase (glutamine-hydrolyzing) [Candidatus Omnitrophota bacterium]
MAIAGYLLSRQPMVDDGTGSVIIYNGEVYNYKLIKNELLECGFSFNSQSDTEVILKAYRKWGKSCVKKFIGMFSFAVWDNIEKGIFVARDRVGIKPLYYYDSERIFMFASRLSALKLHPLCPSEIDPDSLGLYLDMGFVPAPNSIFRGIKKLRPGYTLWIDEKGVSEECYWSIDGVNLDYSLLREDENVVISRLDDLLNDSIKLRMISDVPLGAFLSGGVDSSLIAALMCRYSSQPPKTFSIGFKEKKYDELGYARNIAGYLGTDHHEMIMQSSDFLDLLDANTNFYDEPLADYSNIPTMMVSKFARENVKVALSGDGGDELFAGYHPYFILFYSGWLYNLPRSLRIICGKLFAKISSRKFKVIGQSLCQYDALKSFAFMRSLCADFDRESIFSEGGTNIEDLFEIRSKVFPPVDIVSKFSRLDAAYYLPDDILQKVDVASMSVSLEARVPILDHHIVEFALSLPLRYKLRVGSSKWILKKVLAKYLPPKYFQRPKRGFVAPVGEWFRGELKVMIKDELSPSRIKKIGYLNPKGVEDLVDAHLNNKINAEQILWSIVSLSRWKGRFG